MRASQVLVRAFFIFPTNGAECRPCAPLRFITLILNDKQVVGEGPLCKRCQYYRGMTLVEYAQRRSPPPTPSLYIPSPPHVPVFCPSNLVFIRPLAGKFGSRSGFAVVDLQRREVRNHAAHGFDRIP